VLAWVWVGVAGSVTPPLSAMGGTPGARACGREVRYCDTALLCQFDTATP